MQAVTDRLKNFLQYVAVNLIDEPGHATQRLQAVERGLEELLATDLALGVLLAHLGLVVVGQARGHGARRYKHRR